MPSSTSRWRAASRSAWPSGVASRRNSRNSSCAAAHSGNRISTSGIALAHRIERRAHVQLLDESAGTRLDEHDRALVPVDVPDRGQLGRERPGPRLGGADAEVLDNAWADAHGRLVAALVGVLRHELHIHEGRLAGLVELLLRKHRVVPVEDFPVRMWLRGRRRSGPGRRRHPRHREPVAAASGGECHGDRCAEIKAGAVHCFCSSGRRYASRAQARARSASAPRRASCASVSARLASITPEREPEPPR